MEKNEEFIKKLVSLYPQFVTYKKAGEIVFDDFNSYKKISIVLKGRIRESILSLNGDEFTFLVYRQNQIFGNFSCIVKQTRTSYIKALVNSTLLEIPFVFFNQLIKNNDEMKDIFITQICDSFSRLAYKFESLNTLSANKRFINFLINYYERNQTSLINLSIEAIGNSISCSRETIYKILRILIKKNLVVKNYNKIIINDINQLKDYYKHNM